MYTIKNIYYSIQVILLLHESCNLNGQEYHKTKENFLSLFLLLQKVLIFNANVLMCISGGLKTAVRSK